MTWCAWVCQVISIFSNTQNIPTGTNTMPCSKSLKSSFCILMLGLSCRRLSWRSLYSSMHWVPAMWLADKKLCQWIYLQMCKQGLRIPQKVTSSVSLSVSLSVKQWTPCRNVSRNVGLPHACRPDVASICLKYHAINSWHQVNFGDTTPKDNNPLAHF